MQKLVNLPIIKPLIALFHNQAFIVSLCAALFFFFSAQSPQLVQDPTAVGAVLALVIVVVFHLSFADALTKITANKTGLQSITDLVDNAEKILLPQAPLITADQVQTIITLLQTLLEKTVPPSVTLAAASAPPTSATPTISVTLPINPQSPGG